MSEKLVRTITPEVRVINEAEGLVDYVASDESVDCYAEVIAAKGWRFSRFAKNAPFVDSHDYWSIDRLLGEVVSATVQGRKLVERVRWAKDVPEHNLAQLGWKMTVGGFLKAVSVGFYPVRTVSQGESEWGKTVTELGLAAETAANVRRIFLEQEQIELSACIIGANPNALAKAHKEGCVRDEDLAKCGFEDEDMGFLQAASKALAGEVSEVMRAMIGCEMRRITGKKNFRNGGDVPASSAGLPVGADELAKRQAERDAFLKRLGSIG